MSEQSDYHYCTCQPVLEVRDVREAIHYYREVLGFALDFEVGDPPTYACVIRDGFSNGAPVCIRFTNWLRDRQVVITSGWLNIYVHSGLDDFYEEFRSRGAKVSKDIADCPWGMREFEICDLNGHYLRFGSTIETRG